MIRTMDLDVEYPKTIVIVVTAHGKIQVETNYQGIKEPEIFTIPSGMTLNRISAVVPGVCNFISAPFARKVTEIMRTNIAFQDLSVLDTISPGLIKYFARILREATNKNWTSNENEVVDDDDKTDLNEYNIHSNKLYRSSQHEAYKFALNKYYSTKELSENYDNNIRLLLPDSEMDYFRTLEPPLPGGSYNIDLKTIMYNLSGLGVKNVILVDLSCSKLADETLAPRDIRHLRLDLFKEGMGGNKRSKHKRTNKNSKHNKRSNKRTNKYSKKNKRTNKYSKQNKRTNKRTKKNSKY
jgi:hypothetical protein